MARFWGGFAEGFGKGFKPETIFETMLQQRQLGEERKFREWQMEQQQRFREWQMEQKGVENQINLMKQGFLPATSQQQIEQQFLQQSRGGWGQSYMQPDINFMGQKWMRQTPEPDEMPISDIIKSELWLRYLAGDDSPEVLKGLGMWTATERPEKITSTDIKELEKLVPWWQKKTPLTGQAERDVRTAREKLREQVLGTPQRTQKFTSQDENFIKQYMKKYPNRSREEIIKQMRKQGLL